MIKQKNFTQIIDALDEFYSKIVPALDEAGFDTDGSKLVDIMDRITGAVTSEMEANWLATDEAYDAEPQVFGYLFNTRRRQGYVDANDLYNFICAKEAELFEI